jgi:hypothetical protein
MIEEDQGDATMSSQSLKVWALTEATASLRKASLLQVGMTTDTRGGIGLFNPIHMPGQRCQSVCFKNSHGIWWNVALIAESGQPARRYVAVILNAVEIEF